MFKQNLLSIVILAILAVLTFPFFASAETDDVMIVPTPYPGLPAGVQFELKTEENGRAILATILCENSTSTSLHLSVVGGVVYAENSQIYPEASHNAVAESKLLEGKYDVPAHSKVVIAHVSLLIRPIITRPESGVTDASIQPIPILPFTDWVVRAKLDIVPVIGPIPMTVDAEGGHADIAASDPGDVQCLAYPICYEYPVTVIVEDTIQMDYRWNRLDAIMSAVKRVNSNVVSTQSAVYDVGSQLKVATIPLSTENVKPILSRPSRLK